MLADFLHLSVMDIRHLWCLDLRHLTFIRQICSVMVLRTRTLPESTLIFRRTLFKVTSHWIDKFRKLWKHSVSCRPIIFLIFWSFFKDRYNICWLKSYWENWNIWNVINAPKNEKWKNIRIFFKFLVGIFLSWDVLDAFKCLTHL